MRKWTLSLGGTLWARDMVQLAHELYWNYGQRQITKSVGKMGTNSKIYRILQIGHMTWSEWEGKILQKTQKSE